MSLRLSEALKSTRQLEDRIYRLTDDEIAKAIELEEATLRRNTLIERLRREQRRRERNTRLAG